MTVKITLMFILLDMLSGVIKAFKNKNFKSSIMRQGLFHKSAFIVIIGLAMLCDYSQKFIDLGFNVPLTKVVCIYLIICEISSVLENLKAINPELISDRIMKYFNNEGKNDGR